MWCHDWLSASVPQVSWRNSLFLSVLIHLKCFFLIYSNGSKHARHTANFTYTENTKGMVMVIANSDLGQLKTLTYTMNSDARTWYQFVTCFKHTWHTTVPSHTNSLLSRVVCIRSILNRYRLFCANQVCCLHFLMELTEFLQNRPRYMTQHTSLVANTMLNLTST